MGAAAPRFRIAATAVTSDRTSIASPTQALTP